MREAQILGLNFQEMERREQIAKQKFREVIEEYLETIYKLHGATFWHFKFYSGHFGSSIARYTRQILSDSLSRIRIDYIK